MRVGFTGSQHGITDCQLALMVEIIDELTELTEVHHGDCIGADNAFHTVVRLTRPEIRVVSHPPSVSTKRAYCASDHEFAEKPYLERNKEIVACVDVMMACPRAMKEQVRSGTWATIRHARKTQTPLVILWPDGKYIYEN